MQNSNTILTIETAYDNIRPQLPKEESYDWVIVSDPGIGINEFPCGPEDKNDDKGGYVPRLYIIICRNGKTKIAYPDWWAYNHHGQTELIREWQTMPNSEDAKNIIAFKMLDIPEQVIQSIISNPKSKHSQFYRFYGPENLSTK